MVKVIATHAKDHPEEPYFVRLVAQFKSRTEAYEYVRKFPAGIRPHVIRAPLLEGGARWSFEATFTVQFMGPWGDTGLERVEQFLAQLEVFHLPVRWIGAANGTRYSSLEALKAGLREREKMNA